MQSSTTSHDLPKRHKNKNKNKEAGPAARPQQTIHYNRKLPRERDLDTREPKSQNKQTNKKKKKRRTYVVNNKICNNCLYCTIMI